MSNFAQIGGELIMLYPADSGQMKTFTPMDGVTKAVMTIEYEHHEIHAGSMFRVGEEVALANDAQRNILIVTPDTTKYAHIMYNLSATLESEFEFYEGPTASNNGTAITSYNRNRNSSTVATTLVYHTPTVDPVGTLLASRREGLGKVAGGSARGVAEWILKRNTKYLLRFYSRGGAGTTNYLNWWVTWYEHTNIIG